MRTDVDLTGYKPQIIAMMTQTDGSTIALSNSDFVANSLKFRAGTSESNEITVGGAIIGSCSFRLWTDSGKLTDFQWTNAKIDITLKFSDEAETEIYMGRYYIVSHTASGPTVSVESLDHLKILDEHQLYELEVEWPVDAVDLAERLIEFGTSGLTMEGLGSADRGIMLYDPGFDTMTCRNALSYVAQMLGKYAIIKHNAPGDHVVQFAWYNTETAYAMGTTFDHSLRTSDVTVTGITVVADDEDDTTEQRGEDAYKLVFTDNPFVDANNVSTIADRIYAAVNNLTFRPGNCNIVSTPALEAGDTVTVTTGEETDVKMVATNITYCPTAIKMQIVADCEEADGDLQITRSAYVRRVVKDAVKKYGGGAGVGGGLDPESMYKEMRPSDWLAMPAPAKNQLYFLYHVPQGDRSILGLSFEQSEKSDITIETGTISGSRFVSMTSDGTSTSIGGDTYWTREVYSETYGNSTSDGYCQIMVRITGENITETSLFINFGSHHGVSYIAPTESRANGIPIPDASSSEEAHVKDGFTFVTSDDKDATATIGAGTYLTRGYKSITIKDANCLITTDATALTLINNQLGISTLADASNLKYCYATVLESDLTRTDNDGSTLQFVNAYARSGLMRAKGFDITTHTTVHHNAVDTSYYFDDCKSLIDPGKFAMWSLRADHMYRNCISLRKIEADTITTWRTTSLVGTFEGCTHLKSVVLNHVFATMTDTFKGCSALEIVKLDLGVIGRFTDTTFEGCTSLKRLSVSGENWPGGSINLKWSAAMTRSAIVTLFDSLPTVTSEAIITLNTTAYNRLTSDDIKVATDKGYTVNSATA